MVNHLHALAADAADHQTLQQRGTLTRRALATLGAEGMRILLQPSLILLIFLPGDVAEMGAEQQSVPLILRYSLLLDTLQRPAYASAPIHERACVTRFMQHEQHLRDAQLEPEQLPILGSTSGSVGKQQLGIPEGFHHSAGRTQTTEGLKESANALLHLLVRIENHLALGIVEKANRKWQSQLSPPRFVDQAAAHASLHHVQFRFAHGPLKTEQKPVVKVSGIVEAILIENESVRE